MLEYLWPKICLKEQLKNLENKRPTKWAQDIKTTWDKAGDLGYFVKGTRATQKEDETGICKISKFKPIGER